MPLNPTTLSHIFLKIDSKLIYSFSGAQKITSQNLKIFFKTNKLSNPRLAIQITKKAVKLAVLRNKIRRLVREDFRSDAATMSNIDLLVVISKKISSNKHEISDILMQEWKLSKKSLPQL